MSDERGQNERRQFIRIPEQYIAHFEEYNAQAIGTQQLTEDIRAVTKNLSAGGMLFESSREYPVGTLLRLKLSVPGWEKFKTEFYKVDTVSRSEPVTILASIVRIEVLEPEKKYEIGICFVGIDQGHQIALSKYIDKHVNE